MCVRALQLCCSFLQCMYSCTLVLLYSCVQIRLDLLRTLPNNRHYQNFDSDGIEGLRNVLLAFAAHNPEIGYCQVCTLY